MLLVTSRAVAVEDSASEAAPGERGPKGAEVPADRTESDDDDELVDGPFWVDLGGGYHNLSLRTLENEDDRPSLIASNVDGPMASLGLGLRLLTLSLGVRGGLGDMRGVTSQGVAQHFQVWTLDAELGFGVPIGRLEPHFLLAGGYSAFGGAEEAVSGLGRGLDVSGANVRLGAGVDYHVTPSFGVGLDAWGELMFLNRRGVPIRDLATPEQVATIGEAKARALEADGSSLGTGLAVVAGPRFHF